MEVISYPLIIISALAVIASPGPATLAIASASMTNGRNYGLGLASGGDFPKLCVTSYTLLANRSYTKSRMGSKLP